MATSLTLTIPDAQATRVLNGFCAHHGYAETVAGPPDVDGKPTTIPNPETRLAFAKKVLYRIIKRDIVEYEANQAQREAILASNTDIIL